MALSGGTEVPTASDAASHALVAPAVVMPSAEMLQAIGQGSGVDDGAAGATAQATAEVARVLADAINGGDGSGPNLDALLDAVADRSTGTPVLAQVAGHASWTGGFAVAHESFAMEAFAIHQDSLPQA